MNNLSNSCNFNQNERNYNFLKKSETGANQNFKTQKLEIKNGKKLVKNYSFDPDLVTKLLTDINLDKSEKEVNSDSEFEENFENENEHDHKVINFEIEKISNFEISDRNSTKNLTKNKNSKEFDLQKKTNVLKNLDKIITGNKIKNNKTNNKENYSLKKKLNKIFLEIGNKKKGLYSEIKNLGNNIKKKKKRNPNSKNAIGFSEITNLEKKNKTNMNKKKDKNPFSKKTMNHSNILSSQKKEKSNYMNFSQITNPDENYKSIIFENANFHKSDIISLKSSFKNKSLNQSENKEKDIIFKKQKISTFSNNFVKSQILTSKEFINFKKNDNFLVKSDFSNFSQNSEFRKNNINFDLQNENLELKKEIENLKNNFEIERKNYLKKNIYLNKQVVNLKSKLDYMKVFISQVNKLVKLENN